MKYWKEDIIYFHHYDNYLKWILIIILQHVSIRSFTDWTYVQSMLSTLRTEFFK